MSIKTCQQKQAGVGRVDAPKYYALDLNSPLTAASLSFSLKRRDWIKVTQVTSNLALTRPQPQLSGFIQRICSCIIPVLTAVLKKTLKSRGSYSIA